MKYSIWVELYLAERYMRFFYKNETLKKLDLTFTECIVLYFLIEVNEKMSFYRLKKMLPIETKQLHLTVKRMIEKGYIERTFTKKDSKIWVPKNVKTKMLNLLKRNHSLVENKFSKKEAEEFFLILNKFNNFARKELNREKVEYKI